MSKARMYSVLRCKKCEQRVTRPRAGFDDKKARIRIMYCGKCKKESDFEEIDRFPWGGDR